MSVLYTAQATATGGRTGSARSSDGRLDVTLDTVKELGGSGGGGTNPEQLFAAGYAACFLGARTDAHVGGDRGLGGDRHLLLAGHELQRADGGGFELTIALNVAIPGLDKAKADDLVQKAHVVCPYSQLTRAGADVKLAAA